MPFTGKATVVPSRRYKSRSSGQEYSFFTAWRPDDCDLIERGFTIAWSDGTVGTCNPPFQTEEEAQAYADKWNTERAARYAAAGEVDPYAET